MGSIMAFFDAHLQGILVRGALMVQLNDDGGGVAVVFDETATLANPSCPGLVGFGLGRCRAVVSSRSVRDAAAADNRRWQGHYRRAGGMGRCPGRC
jgi:hypothetical protein